jgi:RND family efflux transporter MFP subunit
MRLDSIRKEFMKMIGSRKKAIIFALLIGVLAFVFHASTHRWNLFAIGGNAKPAASNVLYWYDAMSPDHHFDKPGKAPDGMDLVPMYTKNTASLPASASNASPASAGSAQAPAPGIGERKILYWFDPMHPAYKSDRPGIAPDCGMTLVPKYENDDAKIPEGSVIIPPDKQVLAGVRTSIVERKPLARDIRTTAQIVEDETRIAHVHVKTAGYLEHVYVDYIGQLVKKGEPLFTIYSPDLVSTEEEYLIAKRGDATLANAPFKEVAQGAQSLLESTRQRLRLWDIGEEQIRQLDQSGKVTRDLTFYSPVTGFVTDRKAFPQTSVTPDTELYTVSDLSTVWALVDVYEYEVPFVRIGQRVILSPSYSPDKTYAGTISYIYPTVDPQTRTVKARVQLSNPGFALKPQMFADAQLRVDYGSQILVPQEAVLNSGTEQRVFVVHPGGVFEPRKVTIGAVIDGNVAVLTGLKPGETVVTSGNFLIDSESRLKNVGAQN